MTFETSYNPEKESPSEAVIRAIATVEGKGEAELEQPLYDSIDPDALNTVLQSNGVEDLRVSFMYSGHRIEIQASGRILIQDDR